MSAFDAAIAACPPDDQSAPEPSQRSALGRLRAFVRGASMGPWVKTTLLDQIDDELSRQPEPAPEPSQRGALERLRHGIRAHAFVIEGMEVVGCDSIDAEIQAQLDRQSPDDRAEVERLIAAARLDTKCLSGGRTVRALADLDRIRGGGK